MTKYIHICNINNNRGTVLSTSACARGKLENKNPPANWFGLTELNKKWELCVAGKVAKYR